jgi:hypothetical protein
MIARLQPVPRNDPADLEANIAKLQKVMDGLRDGSVQQFALFVDYGTEGYTTSTSARIERLKLVGILETLKHDINDC